MFYWQRWKETERIQGQTETVTVNMRDSMHTLTDLKYHV